MDRNKRRVTYLTGANSTFGAYGMNDDKKKKNKKKSPFQKILRIVILAAALTAILVVAVMYALNGNTREGIGKITRIGATLSQNVSPFGDSVIFYDGTTPALRGGDPAATNGAIRLEPMPIMTRRKSASSRGRATICISSTAAAGSSITIK